MDIAPPAHAYAHVSEDGTRTQTVYEHLHNTAVLAAGFEMCIRDSPYPVKGITWPIKMVLGFRS